MTGRARARIAVVKLSAEGCAPCKAMAPAWRTFKSRNADRARFSEWDVYGRVGARLAARHRVMSVPTVLFLCRGRVLHAFVGAATVRDLDRVLALAVLRSAQD